MMSERAITRGIAVEVRSFFVPEQSDPERGAYFFSYQIRIENQGQTAVQLLSRHWVITDGRGRVEEVRGPGVIGQQPQIAPGEFFEYESFCPLSTPTGSMSGEYQIRCLATGAMFDAEIPQFFLVEPSSYH